MSDLHMTEGFDVGLEMSGVPSAFTSMLEAMNHGKVALLGIPPAQTAIDWNQVIFKGLEIKGIYGREMFETWYKMVAMLQSGLDLSPIITHRFADDYEKALPRCCRVKAASDSRLDGLSAEGRCGVFAACPFCFTSAFSSRNTRIRAQGEIIRELCLRAESRHRRTSVTSNRTFTSPVGSCLASVITPFGTWFLFHAPPSLLAAGSFAAHAMRCHAEPHHQP